MPAQTAADDYGPRRAAVAALAAFAMMGCAPKWKPYDTVDATGANVVAVQVGCGESAAHMVFYSESESGAEALPERILRWDKPEKWVRVLVRPEDGRSACTVTFFGPDAPPPVEEVRA